MKDKEMHVETSAPQSVVETVGDIKAVKGLCLAPCPQCKKLHLRVGCDRQSGHAGVHHCSNYTAGGPHEW